LRAVNPTGFQKDALIQSGTVRIFTEGPSATSFAALRITDSNMANIPTNAIRRQYSDTKSQDAHAIIKLVRNPTRNAARCARHAPGSCQSLSQWRARDILNFVVKRTKRRTLRLLLLRYWWHPLGVAASLGNHLRRLIAENAIILPCSSCNSRITELSCRICQTPTTSGGSDERTHGRAGFMQNLNG